MKAQLNGITINYEVHGADDAPALVLTHGYTASLEMWREQVPALSERYRLVIYDMRGHGESAAPQEMESYDLARDFVADKLALMDHLGIDRAHVGGLSMGGMVAQEFALQHPERVRSLLLFDTGPGMGLAQNDALQARFRQFRQMMAEMARTKGMDAIVDMMRNNPMAQGMGRAANGVVPATVRRHIEGMRKMSVDGYLGGAHAMQTWGGTLPRLGEIAAPTLVLVGEHDNLRGPSEEIHRRIKGSRFVLVSDSGHGTNMWQPDAFVSATLAFLAEVESSSEGRR